jgi:hypothetical protein
VPPDDVVDLVVVDGLGAAGALFEIDGRCFLCNAEDGVPKEIAREEFEKRSDEAIRRARQRLDTFPNARRVTDMRLPQRFARQRGRASRRRSVSSGPRRARAPGSRSSDDDPHHRQLEPLAPAIHCWAHELRRLGAWRTA